MVSKREARELIRQAFATEPTVAKTATVDSSPGFSSGASGRSLDHRTAKQRAAAEIQKTFGTKDADPTSWSSGT